MKKDAIIVSVAFFLIFLSFNTVQQYFAAIYSDFGKEKIAILALAITYIFYWIGSFVAPIIVRKFGLKKSMIIGSMGYFAFITSIPFQIDAMIMLLAATVGFCASILWNSQGAYLLKITEEKRRAFTFGFFNSLLFAGSFIGIFGASFILKLIDYKILFFALSGIVLLGILTLILLKDEKEEIETTDPIAVFKLLKTKAIFFLPVLAMSFAITGFFVSVIALNMKSLWGISDAGKILSAFWLISIIAPLAAGYLADKIGHIKMLKIAAILSVLGTLCLFSKEIPFVLLGTILLGVSTSSIITVGLPAVNHLSSNKKETSSFYQVSMTTGGVAALLISGAISYLASLYIMLGWAAIALIALFLCERK